MFEIYTKGRSRKSKTANAITKIKRTKGPHWSTKHYSEINRLSIANPTKNRLWTQALRKGKQRNCLPFRSTWVHPRFVVGFVVFDL
jgi:hypothetical protein